MSETIIKVENLYKDFKLPHQKIGTIKSAFTNILSIANNSYETQHALKDISFEIKKGEFFGIVGRNGSGKSTLLKILAGIYQPTSGKVEVHGRLVPFIELGVGFNGELTGRENVFLNGALMGFSEKEMQAKYEEIVTFAGLERFMDQKLKNYSSGMQVRLAFSLAIRAEADILLIDEVLAVGDADFQRKCFEHFKSLKREKKTVVFVTHDMNAVREYCDKAIMIEKSELFAKGNSEEVATKYTKLFLDQTPNSSSGKNDNTGKRWGNFDIEYISSSVSVNDEIITLTLEAKTNKEVKNPNFGFSVRDAGGKTLLGTNSNIKRIHLKKLNKQSSIKIKWDFPNLLQDGEYSVDITAIDESTNVWDWWEGASRFAIFKEERTPYPINPIINLKLTVDEQ